MAGLGRGRALVSTLHATKLSVAWKAHMAHLDKKNDPYVSFKDDKLRKAALVSRDVRYVLIALVTALSVFVQTELRPVAVSAIVKSVVEKSWTSAR